MPGRDGGEKAVDIRCHRRGPRLTCCSLVVAGKPAVIIVENGCGSAVIICKNIKHRQIGDRGPDGQGFPLRGTWRESRAIGLSAGQRVAVRRGRDGALIVGVHDHHVTGRRHADAADKDARQGRRSCHRNAEIGEGAAGAAEIEMVCAQDGYVADMVTGGLAPAAGDGDGGRLRLAGRFPAHHHARVGFMNQCCQAAVGKR